MKVMAPSRTRHGRRIQAARNPFGARWAGLFSVWAHMGIATITLGIALAPTPADDHIAVLRLVGELPAEEGARETAADGDTRQDSPGDRAEGRSATPTETAAAAVAMAPTPAHADAFDTKDHDSPIREQEDGQEEVLPLPEEDPRDEDDWERFVRVEKPDHWVPQPETDRIAAHSTTALVEKRTPVTTDLAGPLTPRVLGPEDTSASPTMERRDGQSEQAAGNRALDADESKQHLDGGGGGGGGGTAAGRGSQARGGDRLAGGSVARSGGGAGQPIAASDGAGLPDSALFPEAPRPDDNARGPDWWQPTAFRRVTSAPASSQAGQDTEVPSPTAGDGVAVVETVGVAADRGGSAINEVEEVALPGEIAADLGPVEGPGFGSADPTLELRRALGWGGIDRDRFAPRPEWAGTLAGQGAAHMSPQTVLDEVAISWEAAISARGTPVGVYIAQVEDIVGARWQRQDMQTHARARGIQGQVTVEYKIRPTGKVTDLTLARSSGDPTLDRMALEAIPHKLPRFPNDVSRETIPHRMVLRYRNPLIATSTFLP